LNISDTQITHITTTYPRKAIANITHKIALFAIFIEVRIVIFKEIMMTNHRNIQ